MDAYVCKIVVIDTKEVRSRPKKLDIRPAKSSIKKCLFGIPDPADTERMVQEQYDIDRKRFIDRFGIDLEHVERFGNDNDENVDTTANESRGAKKSCVDGRKIIRAHRKALKLISPQHVITDFYQARKTVQTQEKDTKLTKEN